MTAVGIQFGDSQMHYLTQAHGNKKFAVASSAPVAGAGAFGTPGYVISGGIGGGNKYAVAATTDEREFSIYMKTPSPSSSSNLWLLADVIGGNEHGQVVAQIESDSSISVYHGKADNPEDGGWGPGVGDTYDRTPYLIGTVPAGIFHFNVDNIHKISIKHHPTAGSIVYRLNGVEVLNKINVNTAASGNNQSTILYTGYNALHRTGGSLSTTGHPIIADTIGAIVGNPRLGVIFPNGIGNYSEWATAHSDPDHWKNIAEHSPNDDTDYNEDGTDGHRDSCQMEDVSLTLGRITGLIITLYVEKTDANSLGVVAGLRIAGVDYWHPTPQGVPGGFAFLQFIWSLSPATGLLFTPSEVNALEKIEKIVAL